MARPRITRSRRRVAVLSTIGLLGAAGAFVLSGSADASESAAAPACGNATLKGRYIFAASGWTISGGANQPFALSGIEHYTGAGTITGTVSQSVNGVITSQAHETGTYSVNADCTGTATYTVAGVDAHFDLYVAPSGQSFTENQTDAGTAVSLTENRVSH
ncbi:hypothetical protein [Krasilnikovia sp. MM14-A1259]|uniref:hypothetical protein n=1 Tax=Krasilnikovia sp. MM14-A1259 TaxID=3373539 RepID=UPI003806F783